MQYPRIQKFNFKINKTYIVQSHQVGRLDKISYELYGMTEMYKPLAAVNQISLRMGYRLGIRKTTDALRIELENTGFTGASLEYEFNRVMNDKRLSNFDWNDYSDISYGMLSDVFEGRPLLVPTFESADEWLKQYAYIEVK